jgi:site-specific recombinase XerD
MVVLEEFSMSETKQESPCFPIGARHGYVMPFVEGFINELRATGYAALSVAEIARGVTHLETWARERGLPLSRFDDGALAEFVNHLGSSACCGRNKGVFKVTRVAARLFIAYLRRMAVVETVPALQSATPPLLTTFSTWMRQHRGLAPRTIVGYERSIGIFLAVEGHEPARYTAAGVRAFVVTCTRERSRAYAKWIVRAVRLWLRFLAAQGLCPVGLDAAVPTVPEWRLSALPRYLEPAVVERVIAACDYGTAHGCRDRAILLLLARLGLRAGDVAGLQLADIDWAQGTIRVCGKGRRTVLLPLPQEVGDALLAYLQDKRPRVALTSVFLCTRAPYRPFASSASIADVVRLALARAGVTDAPSRGAHLLRHSAATAMLRAGSTLETIGALLRHVSPDTTAHYAKVDVATLATVAQPWPGGARC